MHAFHRFKNCIAYYLCILNCYTENNFSSSNIQNFFKLLFSAHAFVFKQRFYPPEKIILCLKKIISYKQNMIVELKYRVIKFCYFELFLFWFQIQIFMNLDFLSVYETKIGIMDISGLEFGKQHWFNAFWYKFWKTWFI